MTALAKQQVLCIGASSGFGLSDLVQFLAQLEPPASCVIMAVLHRPSGSRSILRDVLQRRTNIPVETAKQGQVLQSGRCYIGEPSHHLSLGPDGYARLIPDQHHHYRNRTIDTLFVSAASYARERAIGVVLSGYLDDGSMGLRAIVSAGGRAMARTPGSAGFFDMPRNAVFSAGSAVEVGSINDLAAAIMRPDRANLFLQRLAVSERGRASFGFERA